MAPDGARARRGRGRRCIRARRATAASSRIPRSSGSRSLDAGRRALARARRAGRRGRARQPGRDGARLGPRQRAAAVAGDLVAGPARASASASGSRDARRRGCTALTGLPLDPYFAAPKMALAARARDARRASCTTTDAWLLHRLTRRVRHRRGDRVAHAAARPRRACAWSPEACALVRHRRRRRCRRSSAAPEPVGETTAFGAPLPVTGLAVDQQAALFAEGCLGAGEAKCTYGTGAFLLATVGTRAAALDGRARRLRRLAARRRRRPTASTARSTPSARRCSWLERVGLVDGADDLDRARRQRSPTRAACVFVPGARRPRRRRSGGRRRAARSSASSLATDARAPRARRGRRHRRAGRVARARGRPPTSAAPLARLRVDGGLTRSRVAHAGAGRPAAGAGRGLPVARTRPRSASPRSRASAPARRATPADGASAPWRAGRASYEPRIGADEAEERLARWRRGGRRGALDATARPDASMSADAPFDVAVIGAGVVGAAIARELARYRAARRAARGGGRRRHGHQQGEHRDPAHRLRRQAGHARGAPGAPRLRAARRATARGRHPDRAHRRAAGRLGRASSWPRCPAIAETRGAQRLHGDAAGRRRRALPRASRTSGPARSARCAIPDESIICPFTTPLAFATEAVVNGVDAACSTSPVDGRRRRRRRRRTRCATPRGDDPRPLRRQRRRARTPTTIDRLLRPRDASPSRPRRGELIVFDKLARPLVRHIAAAGADRAHARACW